MGGGMMGGGMPMGPPTTPPASMHMFNPNTNTINIAFSQALSSNWAYGDQNYFAARFATMIYDQRRIPLVELRTTVQLAIGATYTSDTIADNALRVGDNSLFAEEVVVYPLEWMLDPYISANVQTALTESFRYFGDGTRKRTASFWDPVTTQFGAGFGYTTYSSTGMFTANIGLGQRMTSARNNATFVDDPFTFDVVETFRRESGIDFSSMARFRTDSTISYYGRLNLFGTLQDLGVWTVRWDNETQFIIWKSLGLTWKFTVVHDIRYTRRTQIQQAILLGLIQDF